MDYCRFVSASVLDVINCQLAAKAPLFRLYLRILIGKYSNFQICFELSVHIEPAYIEPATTVQGRLKILENDFLFSDFNS